MPSPPFCLLSQKLGEQDILPLVSERLWEELVAISRIVQGPWITLEDFNEALNREDKSGVHTRVRPLIIENFNNVCSYKFKRDSKDWE